MPPGVRAPSSVTKTIAPQSVKSIAVLAETFARSFAWKVSLKVISAINVNTGTKFPKMTRSEIEALSDTK
eukprot:Skav232554  [mRNA]  locus=scaffold3309:37433:37642:+ [translate_table: standard]